MCNVEGIFSMRFVIADFYMQKPTKLDTCYSHFRGKEIKKVPIVRVFGSTPAGQKCCMHIHGVFPYFYIPYENKDEALHQTMYHIATNVDKAINVSLGQASSTTQHVFKIQLVKGIPFYGYHRTGHQFLKIYMYNPRFVRRAANLLQNGAVVGKVFTPFEMHVPYILQFMIDYNLYGMSFLHVPLEIVKFRQSSEETDVTAPTPGTSCEKKVSVCSLEVDIGSNFILNRFQLSAKDSSTHTNPGVEAIWRDERLRRQDMRKTSITAIPSLEVPPSQERPNVRPTDSEVFFRTALLNKLTVIDASTSVSSPSQDHTLNSTMQNSLLNQTLDATINAKKRTFNLSHLLLNSVYPEECTQDDKLANASFVENHLSQNNTSQKKLAVNADNEISRAACVVPLDCDSIFADDTILDDDLFSHLTQSQRFISLNASLREEDLQLLDVLQQLEEDNDNGAAVDLDSTLAPLSQSHAIPVASQEQLEQKDSIAKVVDELANHLKRDYDSDEDNGNPQDFSVVMDEWDELILKVTQSQQIESAQKSRSSPPLPQTDGADDLLCTPKKRRTTRASISNSSAKSTPRSPRSPRAASRVNSAHGSKFQPLPITITNTSAKKNVETQAELRTPTKTVARRSIAKRSAALNLDKTHITCALTPQRKKVDRRLRVYKLEEMPGCSRDSKLDPLRRRSKRLQASSVGPSFDEAPSIDQGAVTIRATPTEMYEENKSEEEISGSEYSEELCRTPQRKSLWKSARPYDSEEQKCTEAATVSISAQLEAPAAFVLDKEVDQVENEEELAVEDEEQEDTHIQSFYDISFAMSPSVFSEASAFASPSSATPSRKVSALTEPNHSEEQSESTTQGKLKAEDCVVVTPMDLPPTYDEVLAGCSKFGIHEFEYQQPFYSNPDDVTRFKEVGHIVLQIGGNKLNDCLPFRSTLGDELSGWAAWRAKHCSKSSRLASGARNRVTITPQMDAPTQKAVRLWLKARDKLASAQEKEESCPEPEPCQPLSATPELPTTPSTSKRDESKPHSTVKRLSKRQSKRTKLLRRKQLEAAKDLLADSTTPSPANFSSGSAASQLVDAALERSSFLLQLQSDTSGSGSAFADTSLNDTFGFKVKLENLQQAKSDIGFHYLTVLTLELFVATRGDLYPNPELDEIRCLFYAIEHSVPPAESEAFHRPHKACGYIIVSDANGAVKEGRCHGIDADIEVKVVATEIAALEALLELCAHWDPDIYAGYEIDMSSWGYVLERAKYLCFNIGPMLSRVPTQKMREFVDEDRESFTDLDFDMKMCGRILLDVWRLMRSEIALTSYTFENVVYHILHKRCPRHSYRQLTEWFFAAGCRWLVLEYYLERVRGTLTLLDQLDLIGRTSEMAKLIGIQFYEVFSRGSQFRVESMMLRIAKPQNLVPISPSVQQRAHMRAPEYLPLILEPQSRFYADPLIVLDFQSLYPSMIIAYNYCFSTCLGRVEHLGQSSPFEFGAAQLRVSQAMLRKLLDLDLVTISPCGVVFVKASVREGILPRMLTEILDTRQMVKRSMKLHKDNSALQRILHSRQLGLKLMANVTYGYTAANFSGRMPCVEVGDTVVAKGRETLERAIKLVEANEKWQVKVVYGDTDSLFVLVPGRSRAQAFQIGEEIVDAVTRDNPQPVKLKLEKVYQPCILQTKKRYVGYMYETPDQKEPVYEAKGIETVRRDGCPAASKMLEKVLRILFETADVSQVKQYVCRQFTKILSGRTSVQDMIFAKEFRGLNGYKPTACVPALELTRKWLQTDPRRIPRSGERVPFVIVNGPPGLPLIRLIRCPHEVLADEGLKLNALYYITKAIIPPLNRCLLLIGADVHEWFTSLPRQVLFSSTVIAFNDLNKPNAAAAVKGSSNSAAPKKSTISQYFANTDCAVGCGRQTKQGICTICSCDALKIAVSLQVKIAKSERAHLLVQQICQACSGRPGEARCCSLDCPVLYMLEIKRRATAQIPYLRSLLDQYCY